MESIFGTVSPAAASPEFQNPNCAEPCPSGPYRTVKPEIRRHSPVLRFDGEHWRSSEQYRIIRTRLVQHPVQPKLIGVSSAAPGDGKTISAANIAAAMALKQDTKVLLVDGDLRRADLASVLGAPTGPGLADVLSSSCSLQEAIVRLEGFPNLHFLPAGKDRSSPTELLDSPAWGSTCEILRKEFEYVVIDAPPIGLVADYDLLQTACDGVLVIVRPEHTNRTQIFQALEAVPPKKLLGVVMNCVQESLFWKRHDYYYYY